MPAGTYRGSCFAIPQFYTSADAICEDKFYPAHTFISRSTINGTLVPCTNLATDPAFVLNESLFDISYCYVVFISIYIGSISPYSARIHMVVTEGGRGGGEKGEG